MKYAWIEKNAVCWPVRTRCRVLKARPLASTSVRAVDCSFERNRNCGRKVNACYVALTFIKARFNLGVLYSFERDGPRRRFKKRLAVLDSNGAEACCGR